ncbi:MAG TPA: S-layer homology domain-containing protein, partial [Vicinamibacteria bacterium]|nr:S-layer homology domain-containing protein [Vicinamibacteria bacterium]
NQECGSSDRHMLIVDRNNRYLYELYDMCWNGTGWEGGSGAFFDMKTNNRRPEGWTSADAAGLAILPGLVRYDEAFGPAEIDHAFRFTVRASNGHVYPASHTAGSTPGALPMGARLRLKAGKDISGELPYVQKIFRAMKTYGLIVADNGSDMYVSGTHDTRWNNGQLNPAFARLSACDFDVVQLGHNPPAAAPAVTALSPAAGTTAGGTAVYVFGTGFNTGASATFGGVPATSVTVLRSTSLLAVTGPHAAGAVDVVVRNADGQAGTRAGGYSYCAGAPAAPALTAPASVVVDAVNVPASATPVPGAVYVWSLTGGTLTSGQGTSQATFDAGPPGTTMRLRVVASLAGCSSAAAGRAVQVDFLDAPAGHVFREYVNTLARNSITGGCGGGRFCVDAPVTRAQMAVFLLAAKYGANYVPPAPSGTVFTDVPANSFAAAYIEQLVREGITGGCATNPPRYCPGDPVTRGQMAVFLLLAKYGSGFFPPAPQ